MPAPAPALAPPATTPAAEPPGGILVWMVVFLELVTFGVGLAVWTRQSHEQPEVFRHGHASLNQPIALANTLILLTGGWCMAAAVTQLRRARSAIAVRWVGGAAFCALAFLVLKSVEYADKLAHGHDLRSDTFFTLYWLLTGFHFLHVLAALGLLAAMAWGLRRGRYSETNYADVEGSGIFWHLCDLIWLLLYPVIYLLT